MRMCEAFGKNGHDTTLIGKQFGRCSSQDAYDFYGVKRNFELALIPCRRVKGINILLLPKLRRILKMYNPDDVIVYARDIYGASLAGQLGYKIIYEAHWPPPNARIRWLEKRLFAGTGFQRLVVISESLKRIYLSLFREIRSIAACHDAAEVSPSDAVLDYCWPGRLGRLQIGYTGHLYPGRGIEIILACAERLPQHDFHIVGGMDADVECWRRRGSANVYFHGFVQPSVLPSVLSKCDLLLMPYQKRVSGGSKGVDTSQCMSPMKLFEYMASRRAIIASDLPVLREILDEQKAVLVAPDEPDQWVGAIRRCEDQACRQALAQNAYQAFLEHHTWERRAQKVLEGIDS
jgi:glycosyltransferase involved in cell wall biosynthesis